MKLLAVTRKTVKRRITVELDQETAAALDKIDAHARASGKRMQLGPVLANYIRRQVRAELRNLRGDDFTRK